MKIAKMHRHLQEWLEYMPGSGEVLCQLADGTEVPLKGNMIWRGGKNPALILKVK